jgi:hypothetical protein
LSVWVDFLHQNKSNCTELGGIPGGRESTTVLHLCNLDITIFYKIKNKKTLIPADIRDI